MEVWSVYCPAYWNMETLKLFKYYRSARFYVMDLKFTSLIIHDLYVGNSFHIKKKRQKPEANKTLAT
jgi:hypothetical protein